MDKPLTEIYVDGSYKDNCVSYAFIILQNQQVVKAQAGKIQDQSLTQHHQIAGELYGLGYALRWCERNQITQVTVHYDYEGIEAWATGRWKAKTPITQRYKAFMQNVSIQIQWQKVKSHSGDYWNQRVDKLAKLACNPTPLLKSFIRFLKEQLRPAQVKTISLQKSPPSCTIFYLPPPGNSPFSLRLAISLTQLPDLRLTAEPSFPEAEKKRIVKLWHTFLKHTLF